MNIEKINVKNFKGIESIEIDNINGKHVYLVGGNGTNKTSLIDAVWCGLTGKDIPPEPTHDGAKKGLIEIELNEGLIARTKFSKGKPTRFELENKDFENEAERFIKAPRAYLEQRLGVLNFDVNEFFKKTDLEQVRYFAKISNIDVSDLDGDIEEITESRRFDKKKLAEVQSKTNFFDKELAAKEAVDVVQLSKKIASEKARETDFNKVFDGTEERKIKAERLKKELETLEKEIKDGETWLKDSGNIVDKEALLKMTEELENANSTNAKIAEAKEAKKANEEADKLEKAIEEANDEIEEKRAQKAKRMSEAINIEGLEYDVKGERFLFNGLPFDRHQINTASQLIAGMKIAASMLKELKIIKVDASLIDNTNFDKVLEWAEKENIELFVERVDIEGGQLQIIIDEN